MAMVMALMAVATPGAGAEVVNAPRGVSADEPLGSAAASRALDDLRALMEHAAAREGRRAHPASNVTLVDKERERVGDRSDTAISLTSDYTVYLRGGLIGINRFEVAVRVKGKLTRADGEWKAQVLGATVLADRAR
jgi:hypothetical protein